MIKTVKYNILAFCFCLIWMTVNAQEIKSIRAKGVTAYYILNSNESTRKPKLSEFMEVNYRMWIASNDSLLNETFSTEKPVHLQVDHPSFKEIFMQASPGDRIQLTMVADSFYKHTIKQPLPSFIRKGDSISFFIKVIDITDNEGLMKKQMEADAEQIYVDSFNYSSYLSTLSNVKTTNRGLNYVVSKEGTGRQPKSGDSVTITYRGYFLDGEVFDKNMEGYTFLLGVGRVVPGLDEGVMLMKEGSRYKFAIPYFLAYGTQGTSLIPPYASLIFDVELVSVKENFKKKQ